MRAVWRERCRKPAGAFLPWTLPKLIVFLMLSASPTQHRRPWPIEQQALAEQQPQPGSPNFPSKGDPPAGDCKEAILRQSQGRACTTSSPRKRAVPAVAAGPDCSHRCCRGQREQAGGRGGSTEAVRCASVARTACASGRRRCSSGGGWMSWQTTRCRL